MKFILLFLAFVCTSPLTVHLVPHSHLDVGG